MFAILGRRLPTDSCRRGTAAIGEADAAEMSIARFVRSVTSGRRAVHAWIGRVPNERPSSMKCMIHFDYLILPVAEYLQ